LLGGEAAREAAERARTLADPTRLMLATALRESGEIEKIFEGCLRVDALENGYEFSFPGCEEWVLRLMEFIVFERECCPFFAFELVFEPEGGSIRLWVQEPEGAKEMVAGMISPRAG
jgi:hypothetical protein